MIFLKAFHLFFLILWLGALFYVPYLKFKKFEKAQLIYFCVELPAMCLAIATGVVLLTMMPAKLRIGLFHMKLTCVMLLIGIDLYTGFRKTISKRALIIIESTTVLLVLAILVAIQTMKSAA
jgi:uncharacterized membrane protein